MIFWLIFLTKAEDLCSTYVESDTYGSYFGVSWSDYISSLDAHEKYSINCPYPFMLRLYVKDQYCSDWVLISEENITNAQQCTPKVLIEDDIPKKCSTGHYVNIVNEIDYDYNMTIFDRKNESHIIPYHYEQFKRIYQDKYFEQFYTDVYVKSPFNDELCYIGKFESWPDDNTLFEQKNHSITLSMVPTECHPYQVCIHNRASHFHNIEYISTIDNERKNINYDWLECPHSKDPFTTTVYLKSGLSCEPENPIEIQTIESKKKNYITFNLTDDNIPPECKIENYPDDNAKYEPDHSGISNIPYTFIYEGDCDKFNTIVQKCQNKTVNYPFCSFTNNALDSLCYSEDVLKNININTEKIFIVLSSDDNYLKFKLKHPTIVHVKSTDYKDPELFFQKFSDSPSKNLTLKISANKISFLTLTNINLTNRKYYEPDLVLDTLYLKSSCISSNIDISVNNVINECSEGVSYYTPTLQYIYALKNHSSRPVYHLQFYDDYFLITERNWYEDFYHAKELDKVYYDWKKTIGINFVSHFFDFYMYMRNDKSFNPLNLSIMSLDDELTSFSKQVLLEDQSKYYINITTSGNWYDTSTLQFNFTGYHDYLNIEKHLDPKLRMNQLPVYEYHPVDGWAPKIYQPIDINDTSLLTYIIITEESHISTCNDHMRKLLGCRFTDGSNYNCRFDENWDLYDINYIIDGKCIKSDDISDTLSNIMPETDKLIIENEVDEIYIDFNDLPHQCVVKITSFKQLFDSNRRGKLPKIEDESKLIWKTININGGIKSKVSYLTVSNSFLSISGGNLDIHTIRMTFSSLIYGLSINTNDLIVDFASHVNLFNSGQINVKQYGLIVPYEGSESDLKYIIEFNSDRWSLFTEDSDGNTEPIDDNYGYVPYEFADMVGLIILSHEFKFKMLAAVENKKVNITLLNEELLHNNEDDIDWVPKNESKYNVTFTDEIGTGNIPTIHLTAYHDLIYVDSGPNINIIKDDWVNYTTHPLITPSASPVRTPMPTMTPLATYFPTQTPLPEKVANLYEETQNQIAPEQFIKDLNTKFEELKDENKPQENLVVVVNAKSIPFQSNLIENQYIKPIPDAKIDFINGNLNMVLPDDGTVTVSLKDSQDVKLKLKGSGNIKFEKEDSNTNINIKENANINGSLSITVPDGVEGITINSLDFSNNGKIECKIDDKNVPITVQSINVSPYSGIEMNNVIVNDTLTVSQTAQVTLHDVNLTNSKITYNLINFNDLDSILLGEFDDPPESFDINLIDSTQSPIMNYNYLIAKGTFNSNCNLWKDKIKFGDSKIEKSCGYDYYPYNNYAKLASDQYLTLKFKKDDDNKNNGKDKLPPGAIAGIVVGVIVAIAIVVVVVIFVLKKKKGQNSSTQENDENGTENI